MVNEPSKINQAGHVNPTYFAGIPKKLPQKENSAEKEEEKDVFLAKILDDSYLTDESNYKFDYKNLLTSIWQHFLSLLRNIKNFLVNILQNIINFINKE